LIAAGASVVAACFLPFLPLPASACVPWLIASVCIHQVYYVLVASAYRAGDMGHAYPLMRGAAPLLVAMASAPLLGETLTTMAWLGVALICSGVLLLALHRHAPRRATMLALSNAFVIALYTIVDGSGARASGNAVSFVVWLTFVSGMPLTAWLLWRNAERFTATVRGRGLSGLIGGACSVASYGLALWAMTRAPLASVAALRETSVLFAVAISTFVLREVTGTRRIIAAVLVVGGAAALRLA